MKQKNFFNEIKYDKLYPSGSAPARVYATPKIHKFSCSDSFPKLRPIVSSIGTFNYNLARFLCRLLSPLVPNDYSCKDTFSFVSQIKNANISQKFLAKYQLKKISDCSWDNSYCMRLVIVSLAVNIGKLQSFVSKDNFFCRVYNDFWSDFLFPMT